MAPVLNWIKANVVIVIFVVLMLAALIALPLFAGKMNAAVKKDVETRLSKGKKLDAADEVTIDLASGPVTALPHRATLDQFKEHAAQRDADASQLRDMAVAHNRKNHGLILPALFPLPPEAQREVLPAEFHKQLVAAHEGLLKDVRAGSPPTAESLATALDQADAQFRINTLRKSETESLSPDEAEQLRSELTKVRLEEYARAAESVGLYVSPAAVGVPNWVQGVMPSPTTLFDWQWQFWITDDILHALAEVNSGAASVTTAPVKRVVSLRLLDSLPVGAAGPGDAGRTNQRRGRPAPDSEDEDGAPAPTGDEEEDAAPPPRPAPAATSGAGGRRPAPGRSSGSGAAPAGAAAAGADSPPQIDFTREAPLDYRVSFTGRTTNPLYDVRYVQLRLIVETARIPQVMQALARRNFITIIDASVRPVSAFDGIRFGYFYGDAPLSELNLELETIWLREWTAQFMPPDLRAAFGIAAKPAAG